MNPNIILYRIAREIRNAIHENRSIEYLIGIVMSIEFIPCGYIVEPVRSLKEEIRLIKERETGQRLEELIREYLEGFSTSIISSRENINYNQERSVPVNNNFMEN